ncbi:MAG: GerMN domain-containing protein [Acidobacteriota bacterium]|jgi:germination protein M
MSRKEQPLPWRVIAIAVALFVGLAAVGWLLLGPEQPPAPGDSTAAPAPETTPESGTTPTAPPPATGQQDAVELDPSTPEGRAALAAARSAAGTMNLQLFMIVPGLERLVPVSRTLPAPPATLDAQVKRAVEELIHWNGTETISPVAPEAELREVWVSPGGIAYLDFDRSLFDFSGGGSLGELQTVYGIVATVTTSFPEIVAVQLLIDGEQRETLAGHVDISMPLLPSDEWVLIERDQQQDRQSNEPL